MGVDRRRWICPLRGHLKGRMQYAPTLPADGTRWPIKWFPTEANERRAHVSENIPGANGRRAHVLENIPGADERQRPLSNVRVGAYCIRPRCSRQGTIAPNRHPPLSDLSPAGSFEGAYAIRPYPTGGWDAVAREMVSDRGEWASGAAVGRPCRGAKAYAPKRSEHGTTACGREPPVKRFPTEANRRFGHLLDSNLQANEC